MRVLLLALFAGLFALCGAQAQPLFETRATHAAVLDYETGEVLYSKNGEDPMPPASMSKLMTVLMAFEAIEAGTLSLEDELPVSAEAWRKGGAASGSSTMFLEPNSRARVADLLRGVIVQSGNDACIVLAEAISGSEDAFAQAMTERARELGLESANFTNSTGWPDPDHLISAIDLARLAAIIIRDHPDLYDIYSVEEFTYNGIRQFNRNPLLGVFDGADGLKTGHTEASGYGLVGSAVRDDERRIIVFNGMESTRARASEAERLMRAAFTDFDVYELFPEGATLGTAPVFLGEAAVVPLRLAAPVKLGLHRRARSEATAEVVLPGELSAPVQEGQAVGELVVSLPDGRTERYPVEAAAPVARKGLGGRAMAALVSFIRGG